MFTSIRSILFTESSHASFNFVFIIFQSRKIFYRICWWTIFTIVPCIFLTFRLGNRFFRCSSFLGLYTLTPLSLVFILWNFQNLQFLTMIQKLMEDPQIIRNIHPIIPILGCSTDLVSAVWWNSNEELSLHSHCNLLEVFKIWRVKCLETLRIHFCI